MKDPDLLGCWPFDETSGMTAYDKSLYGNDGALINMEEEDHVPGKVNNGLDFSVDEYVDLPEIVGGTSAVTFVAWIKTNKITDKQMIFAEGGANLGYALYVVGAKATLAVRSSSSALYPVLGTTDLTTDAYFMIAGVYGNSKVKIYINGKLENIASGPSSVSNPTELAEIGIDIGSFVIGEGAPFDGIIDEVRIYKRALRADEIKTLYDSPRRGFRLVAGKTYTYEHAFTDRVIVDFEKVFEDGDEYTEKASINEVEATASTFYFDTSTKILYVHASTGGDPRGFYTGGGFWMYMSNKENIEFNGNFYLPLLSKGDIPDISQEIKPYFEGSFSISSGSIAFNNAEIKGEHFFDKRFGDYTWINAKTILKAGGPDFTYAQFKEIFTALINEKSCSDRKITFQLRDIREEMRDKIVLNTFNKTEYPGVEEKFKDKPRPIYFGGMELITPVCIDEVDEKFECNDGRIKSIDAVYKNNVLLVENTHYYVDQQRARLTFDRDGAFIITAGVNDKIDFKEGTGSELNVTLDPDTYTPTTLCAEIKAKMEAANSLIFSVTCPSATKKFKIEATGNFSLLWKTGTNGSDNLDTHVGTTIGFSDDEDDTGDDGYEAGKDMISIHKQDIIGVRLTGIVNSADEPLYNGAEIFKYLMNNYRGLADSELNLDSIYEAKYANENDLAIPIEKEISFDEVVRTIEHSVEAYTFQDELGRLGIRPQQTVVASKAKYIIGSHTFSHFQKKGKSSLFWKVNIHYNRNLQTDDWEWKTATDDEILWKYGMTKELDIYTYFSVPSHANDLATSILNLLNKEQIEDELPMLLFDVMPGDLVKFSRDRFYDSDGVASEITLRIIKISKSPASGKTRATMEKI